MIFVHGIGSQESGETLRDWGGAIIRVLAQFRIGEGEPADPVVKTQLDPGSGKTLYIEVELPEIRGPENTVIPAEHWVMTEAWWAQRVAPPPFSQMAQWLGPGGAVRRIVAAMFAAQGRDDPRQREWSEAHLLGRPIKDPDLGEELDELSTYEREPPLSMLRDPVDVGSDVSAPQASAGSSASGTKPDGKPEAGSPLRPGPLAGALERLGVGVFLQAVSALVLLLYGFLRSIEKLLPIGPLKNGALTRPIDNFLLNWFGDVHVLLGDPAQSASVQARLVDAIWNLEAIACKPITIVAHSGGAIVTYLTLADPATADLRVDRVITHGEAANLGWRLTSLGEVSDEQREGRTNDVDAADVYGDLYRSIKSRSHPVLWTDMWASQDPAPVGLLAFPRVPLPQVESIGVWNRLSFREDHGTYWTNDEEFVVPLLRRLVGARTDATRDRFGSDADHRRRSRTRRERLAVLSFWTQICRVLPTIAVVHWFSVYAGTLSAAAADASAGTVAEAGHLATTIWNAIPGHEAISEPLAQLHNQPPEAFAPGALGDGVAQLGVWVIAIVLGASAIFSLRVPPERSALFKGKLWTAYDVFFAVALRAVVLFLLVRAFEEFTKMGKDIRPEPLVVVAVVIALAGLEVGLARLVGRLPESIRRRWRDMGRAVRRTIADLRGPNRGPSRVRFAAETALLVLVLAGSVVVVVAPFVAMAVFPKTGNVVLGTIVIFFAFQLLLAVGKWRWGAWDERQRVETQRRRYKVGSNWAVGVQMTIHMAAAVLLYFWIIEPNDSLYDVSLLTLALLAAGSAVLIGVGIDVVTINNRRSRNSAENITQLMRTTS